MTAISSIVVKVTVIHSLIAKDATTRFAPSALQFTSAIIHLAVKPLVVQNALITLTPFTARNATRLTAATAELFSLACDARVPTVKNASLHSGVRAAKKGIAGLAKRARRAQYARKLVALIAIFTVATVPRISAAGAQQSSNTIAGPARHMFATHATKIRIVRNVVGLAVKPVRSHVANVQP